MCVYVCAFVRVCLGLRVCNLILVSRKERGTYLIHRFQCSHQALILYSVYSVCSCWSVPCFLIFSFLTFYLFPHKRVECIEKRGHILIHNMSWQLHINPKGLGLDGSRFGREGGGMGVGVGFNAYAFPFISFNWLTWTVFMIQQCKRVHHASV